MAKKAKDDPALQYPPAPAYFNDACAYGVDKIFVSGKLKTVDPEEHTFSRLTFYRRAGWGRCDLADLNIMSVCYSGAPFADYGAGAGDLYALSARGEVFIPGRSDDGDRHERLPKVAASLSQIRAIDGVPYVCGMRGQVFRRDPKGWVHVDQGILETDDRDDALHLNGIDGTSDRNIYVAGFSGRILHFNGSRWTELTSPTNVHLERVHCAGPDEVYFCGNRGTFLQLKDGTFTDHSIPIEDHFWGLTSFRDKIYLATLKGLYVFDGQRVRPVDTKLKPPIDGHRLDARDGQLWSFGVDDLAWFDGKKWRRLDYPDNQ